MHVDASAYILYIFLNVDVLSQQYFTSMENCLTPLITSLQITAPSWQTAVAIYFSSRPKQLLLFVFARRSGEQTRSLC